MSEDVELAILITLIIILVILIVVLIVKIRNNRNPRKYKRSSSLNINSLQNSNENLYQNEMYRMENADNGSVVSSTLNCSSPNDATTIDDNIPFYNSRAIHEGKKKSFSKYFTTNPLKSLFHSGANEDELENDTGYYPKRNGSYSTINNHPNPFYAERGIGIKGDGNPLFSHTRVEKPKPKSILLNGNINIEEPNKIHLNNQINPHYSVTFRNGNDYIDYIDNKNEFNPTNKKNPPNLKIMITPPTEGILVNRKSPARVNFESPTKSRLTFYDPYRNEILRQDSTSSSIDVYPNNNNNNNK